MREQQQAVGSSSSLVPVFPSFLNKPHAGWILAGVVGLVLLAVNLHFHVIGDYHVETDFYWSYAPEAQRILSGKPPVDEFRGPGYPAVLALVNLLVSDIFRAGIVVATVSAAVVLALVFTLFQRLFRKDVALAATLLVAFNTTFIQYSYTVGTDMVFNAFVMASVYFLLRDAERKWSSVVLSALFAGLAYLTRYNGIFVLGAVPIVLLLANPFHLDRKERLKTCAVYLAVFFLVIAPWGVYSLQERGSFFYNKNYLNIAYEMFAEGRMSWDEFWFSESKRYTSLIQVITTDVGQFLKTLMTNILEHGVADLTKLVGPYTGIFSLVGVLTLFRKNNDPRVVSYFLLAAGFFAILLLVFYGERFSLFLLPAYVALALKALRHPRVAHRKLFGRVPVANTVVVVLLVWTAVDSWRFNAQNINSGPKEILSIAEAFHRLNGNPPPDAVVVARKPHIAHYLGMRMELFPLVSTFDELKAEVRRVNGSYLFYSSVEAKLRPQFLQLFDLQHPLPWLQPIAYTSYPPAVLFRVRWTDESRPMHE
jgi:hypothetical protein